MTTRIVELRRGILKKNDELAAGLRERYTAGGVLVLNLVSSPGTGKTAFLERTLRELKGRGARVAALVSAGAADQYPWNLPPGRGDDFKASGRVGVSEPGLPFH